MNHEKDSVSGIFSEYGQIRKPTYKEQAYRLIKEAILYQKFQPDKIYSQEAICQELGVSRTPVREALLELQSEGYIVFCRGKGIQIVTLDDKSIHDILEMRLYLEITAAHLAAMRADKKDLAYIEQCLKACYDNLDENNESRDIAVSYRLDHQFHRAVALAAHNELLCTTLDNVLDLYLRFEVQTVYHNVFYANAIMEEHRAIFEAVSQHDQMKASFCAQTHLEDAYRRTLSKYWS
ncbi:MAG: GntR family transcriptional regulator [Lachnospiraceae bacterium]|nr:GntR family transcriptional regulator [Lachnospiraceae bacterium]